MHHSGSIVDGEDAWPLAAAMALRRIARDEALKAYILATPPLYGALLRAARRFIGGETLRECLATAEELALAGHAVTIDFMGESTRDAAVALAAVAEFERIVAAIGYRRLPASVSLDLSHIGLAIDPELAFDGADRLAGATRDAGVELMISMEGSERTGAILALHERLCARHAHVGVTLQANLLRTPTDLAAALGRSGRIRLVKGAYAEPGEIALPRGAAVDAAYLALLAPLFASDRPCSVATHDPALLAEAMRLLGGRSGNADAVEFEMLHGVTPERLTRLRARGYRTRIYLTYGREWYLYLCHRLAEYPPSIYRALADMAVGSPIGGAPPDARALAEE